MRWIPQSLPSDVKMRCVDKHVTSSDDPNQSCTAYNQSKCSISDTLTFTASEVCCVCGGGDTIEFADSPTRIVNTKGFSCSDISRLVSYGFDELCTSLYDTDTFTASEMCLDCGGGKPYCSLERLQPSTYAELQSLENCTEIHGSLLISKCTDCTDLLPLSSVTTLVASDSFSTTSILIDNNDALTSLEGIEQLL